MEFENEILLLQNLQHQNIVKLIGYCIHKEERILVHEYMPNGSLDYHIFDEETRRKLKWTHRFKIIMGIARGILYLHQDSGSIIIHRDLKPSNILLDIEMNPKISDFRRDKTLEEHPYESTTSLICGTFGYMCPEYAVCGKVSVMTDVYSFGVLVLEIVSGRKCINRNLEYYPSLIFHAWELWNEEKAIDVVDEFIGRVEEEEVVRCIKVGLLCTQKEPHHRPTVDSVIKLLEGQLSMELQGTPPWWLEPQREGDVSCNRDGLELKLDEDDATFEYDVTLER